MLNILIFYYIQSVSKPNRFNSRFYIALVLYNVLNRIRVVMHGIYYIHYTYILYIQKLRLSNHGRAAMEILFSTIPQLSCATVLTYLRFLNYKLKSDRPGACACVCVNILV